METGLNVLCDFHHADLWWSLTLLFEKRFKYKLWRPYGMEWYDSKYYRIYGDLRKRDPYRWLAKQYLVDTIYDYNPSTKTGIGKEAVAGCADYPKFNLLTFEESKDITIDIIICSVHENEEYFSRLRDFHPNALFIRQVGNNSDPIVNHELYPNLLSSAIKPYNDFKGKNKILYRQEFDMELFKYQKPVFFKNIYNFQGDLIGNERTWDLWLRLTHNLRDYNFKSYGVGNESGFIRPKRDFIKAMLESSFVFNVKEGGDGFGHVMHNAMCLGRIPIVKKKDYINQMAEPFLDLCLCIDDISDLECTIRQYSDQDTFMRRSEEIRDRFHKIVNFDNEFKTIIKPFIENLYRR